MGKAIVTYYKVIYRMTEDSFRSKMKLQLTDQLKLAKLRSNIPSHQISEHIDEKFSPFHVLFISPYFLVSCFFSLSSIFLIYLDEKSLFNLRREVFFLTLDEKSFFYLRREVFFYFIQKERPFSFHVKSCSICFSVVKFILLV